MSKNRTLARLICCTLVSSIVATSPLGSLIAHAATSTTPLAPTSLVILGEVAWAGSSLSASDEWLELWNTSDAPVSLAGWSLRGAGESDAIISFSATSTIPAQSAYLISNYQDTDPKSVLATPAQLVSTKISLSNSQLRVDLVDNTGAVVDSAGGGGTPPAGTNTSALKGSMLRVMPSMNGTLKGSWASSANSQNIKPDATDLGTPGICDGCSLATPAPATSLPSIDPAVASTDPTTDTIQIETDTATTTTDSSGTDVAGDTVSPLTTTSTNATTASNASSSQSTSDLATTTTSTTGAITTATTTLVTTTSPSNSNTQPDPPTPSYRMLRLNEIEPNPASGKEWIEITTLDASQSLDLAGCTLSNSKGRIRTIGTDVVDPLVSKYAIIALTSSRLKNDGDSVSLYAPNGQLLDTMSYTTTKKGQAWIRSPDMTGDWRTTITPTPGASNVLTASPTLVTTKNPTIQTSDTSSTTSTPPDTTSSSTSSEETASSTTSVDASLNDESEPSLSQLALDGSVSLESIQTEPIIATDDRQEDSSPTVSVAPTKAKKATVKKKATSAKAPNPIHPLTFDMLTQDISSTIRVRLTGRVGSIPGLLAVHTFVLQNPDGRGLLVSVPSTRRLPAFGSEVSVVGTLRINDTGVASLKVGAKDSLTLQATSTTPIRHRDVDTLSPSTEDAWSLIDVTGTVTSVSTSIVQLDLGDASAEVLIKPVIKYRAKRLVIGDTVHVTGLLDTSKETPRIVPRGADEIQLIAHAPSKTQAAALAAPSPPTSTLPGWTPFGAAAGAVAVTEGAKQFHKRRKIKLLEQRAAALVA